jgi:hypothetical protein
MGQEKFGNISLELSRHFQFQIHKVIYYDEKSRFSIRFPFHLPTTTTHLLHGPFRLAETPDLVFPSLQQSSETVLIKILVSRDRASKQRREEVHEA